VCDHAACRFKPGTHTLPSGEVGRHDNRYVFTRLAKSFVPPAWSTRALVVAGSSRTTRSRTTKVQVGHGISA